ncbi:hypothetical protein M427DRAFT_388187 [Gonapodya prolifera JEL478]|uniref:Uncharacterized protein n=1 Tax=Gonapodya prolifera (strain JEL478) TaxID=1344416 RepID=A0A139A8G3_GONPJ|nr:hypothetical protein M427DRAFT_388187 [Gonapodya prolifera JEL478]|eukprot:KXS12989.1 hypothetical protein M427DRAFT_388187 [Gonapodya prolifera JEL478]
MLRVEQRNGAVRLASLTQPNRITIPQLRGPLLLIPRLIHLPPRLSTDQPHLRLLALNDIPGSLHDPHGVLVLLVDISAPEHDLLLGPGGVGDGVFGLEPYGLGAGGGGEHDPAVEGNGVGHGIVFLGDRSATKTETASPKSGNPPAATFRNAM